jgi:hypothetical protein
VATAKHCHRQIKKLTKSLEESMIEVEACQNMLRQVTTRKSLKEKQEAQKALEAIPEPSTESIVTQEIANAELNAPLCPTCYLKMTPDKREMPFIMGSVVNWNYFCKGPPQNPHPIWTARHQFKLLYPWRDALNPETFKAATSTKPTTEVSTVGSKSLVELQIELAQRMAPNCPECGAKMTLKQKEPLSTYPESVEYQYHCHGSKATRLHTPAILNYQIPLLKHVPTDILEVKKK